MNDVVLIEATADDLKVLVGRRLATQLKLRQSVARDLAEHLGKSVRTVQCWVDGTNMMPTGCIVQAAHWFGIDPAALLPHVAPLRTARPAAPAGP